MSDGTKRNHCYICTTKTHTTTIIMIIQIKEMASYNRRSKALNIVS